MTPCQKKQQMRKIVSYQKQCKEATEQYKEFRKRAEYFQGLVNQVRAAMADEATAIKAVEEKSGN